MYVDNPITEQELFNYAEMKVEEEKKIKMIEEKKKETVQNIVDEDDDDSFMSDSDDKPIIEPKIIKKLKTE